MARATARHLLAGGRSSAGVVPAELLDVRNVVRSGVGDDRIRSWRGSTEARARMRPPCARVPASSGGSVRPTVGIPADSLGMALASCQACGGILPPCLYAAAPQMAAPSPPASMPAHRSVCHQRSAGILARLPLSDGPLRGVRWRRRCRAVVPCVRSARRASARGIPAGAGRAPGHQTCPPTQEQRPTRSGGSNPPLRTRASVGPKGRTER